MRIASVNQDPGISPTRTKGAAVHLVAMRSAFRELGAQVICVDESEELKLRRHLEGLWDEGPIDFIYERYALAKPAAAQFAVSRQIPLVLEVNAPLAEEAEKWRGRALSDADRHRDFYVFRNATTVIAVSNQVAAYAVERGARAHCVTVCPNGIDHKRFQISARQNSVREQLIPPGQFVVGFHGRLRRWHGFDHLVQVCLDLRDHDHPVHLLAVGDGDFSSLHNLPEDCWTHVPWRAHEEMPRYIAAFDFLPLTYAAGEPCYFSPLKLMEAMACGVVPLVPNMGDLPEIVRDGDTGLVYQAGNYRDLASQIGLLLSQPAKIGEIGANAARAAAECTWTRIAQFVLNQAGAGLSFAARQDDGTAIRRKTLG